MTQWSCPVAAWPASFASSADTSKLSAERKRQSRLPAFIDCVAVGWHQTRSKRYSYLGWWRRGQWRRQRHCIQPSKSPKTWAWCSRRCVPARVRRLTGFFTPGHPLNGDTPSRMTLPAETCFQARLSLPWMGEIFPKHSCVSFTHSSPQWTPMHFDNSRISLTLAIFKVPSFGLFIKSTVLSPLNGLSTTLLFYQVFCASAGFMLRDKRC